MELQASVQPAEEQPLFARIARIDHDQVYWGLGEPVPLDQLVAGDRVFGEAAIAAKLPEGAVYIALGCDLAGGLYRLAAPDDTNKSWHFVPLEPEHRKSEPGVPTLEQAVYDLITIGADAPRVAAWAKWFQSTTDEQNKGA